ncbi:MAG: long-chain-fatty-acid--CoA ligase [Deltaproteobacteria bacterium]|nr:long-chain-fatty-acid--CoA ligase [Deltaproteobacteria bacterium]
MNIAGFLNRNIDLAGEKLSLIYEEERFTNLRIHEMSCRLAAGLRSLGIGKGDHVAVFLPNCTEVILAYQAIWRVGAVAVPIMSRCGLEEARHILQDSEAGTVITDETHLDLITAAKAGIETLHEQIVLEGTRRGIQTGFHALLCQNPPDERIEEVAKDETALIIYTSGTTGKPKGVMLTHHNLRSEALGAWEAWEWQKGPVTLNCLPLAHSFGIAIINVKTLCTFREGFDVLMRWFDPEEVFRLIERYKVNQFFGVPTMYSTLLTHPAADKYDLSSLERCYVGAAPVPEELHRSITRKLKCELMVCYALTEASPGVTITRPSAPYRGGSSGMPFPGVEVRISDPGGRELPPYEKGEILVRGPNVMKGYYKRHEETRQSLQDGWLHTGDVGYLDKDGYLFVTDRIKDLIIKGGTNIYPAEIEGYIKEHPAVQDVSVVGVPHEKYGEDVMAFAVLTPGHGVSEEELLSCVKSRVAGFKCPSKIKFVHDLPKTQTGKINKSKLREMIKGAV